MLKELCAKYEEKYAAEEQRQEAERLKGNRHPERTIVHWKTEVIEPLAKELARQTGKKAFMSGPFGVSFHVKIILSDNPEDFRHDPNRLELTVRPDFEDGHLFFWYQTGETCEEYESGTMGEINRLNYIVEKLPDKVEEILKLFKGVA